MIICVQLCDFGLATWTSAPSVPFLCKTVKGTFGYDFKTYGISSRIVNDECD